MRSNDHMINHLFDDLVKIARFHSSEDLKKDLGHGKCCILKKMNVNLLKIFRRKIFDRNLHKIVSSKTSSQGFPKNKIS